MGNQCQGPFMEKEVITPQSSPGTDALGLVLYLYLQAVNREH